MNQWLSFAPNPPHLEILPGQQPDRISIVAGAEDERSPKSSCHLTRRTGGVLSLSGKGFRSWHGSPAILGLDCRSCMADGAGDYAARIQPEAG